MQNEKSMDKSKEEKIKALQEEVEKLPQELQEALFLAAKNYNLIECLCKDTGMSDEEIEKLKLEAKEQGDYFCLVLLCAAQIFNNNDESTAQP